MNNVLVFRLKNSSPSKTSELFTNNLLNDIKKIVAGNIFLPLFDKYTFNKNVDLHLVYDIIAHSENRHLLLNVSYIVYREEWYGYIQVENDKVRNVLCEMNEIELIPEHTLIYSLIFNEIQRNHFQVNEKQILSLHLLDKPLKWDEFVDILKSGNIKENESVRFKALVRFFINKEIKNAKPHVSKFSLATEFLFKYQDFVEEDFMNNYPDVYKDFELYYNDFLYVSVS